MKLNLDNIFLLDGIGALSSAAFSGLLLPAFSSELGLPITLLHSLSFLALGFSAYSLIVHFSSLTKTKRLLLIILLANGLYGLISIATMVYFDSITHVGRLLLLAELLVLTVIIGLEVRVYRGANRRPQR